MTAAPKSRIGTAFSAAILIVFLALAIFDPHAKHYPYVKIDVSLPPETASNLVITTLMKEQHNASSCDGVVNTIIAGIVSTCANCKIVARSCLTALSPSQHALFTDQPSKTYSARLPNGYMTYESTDPQYARAACEAAGKQTAANQSGIRCFPPNVERPSAKIGTSPGTFVLPGMALLLLALATSCFICWLIVRFEHLHSHLSHDQTDGGPQKFHEVPTPRVGGVAVYSGLIACAGAALVLPEWFGIESGTIPLLLIATIPAFLGGLIEDVTKKVQVLDRLLLTMASGVLAAWLLGAVLNRLDIPGGDLLLAWLPFAILLTAFAVGGIANAINIIDGYNGLAAGFSVIILCAFAWVSAQVQDILVFSICLSLIGALVGFLIWNWPRGKIFLGDGGAYLLGFMLAEIAVLLVVRNPLVSPWFPVLLLIYPIYETLFSIFRKKFLRGHSPGHPDGLHLHMLVYKRLLRYSSSSKRLNRNSRVAAYFWIFGLYCFIAGVTSWGSTTACVILTILFCVLYVLLYQRIIRFRTPRFLHFLWR